MVEKPKGEERDVRLIGGPAIDGAPIAYVVVLAAVVTALGFVPFSVMLSLGGSFPLSQTIFALVGWILGPIAGAVATGVGRLLGVFMAPYTAGSAWPASVWAATVASFAAGAMGRPVGGRKWWWTILTVIFVAELLLFVGRAVYVNGVGLRVAVLNSFVNWSSILLFALPTRRLFARWIGNRNVLCVSAGLFFGTWIIAGLSHLSATSILYTIQNWPEEVWIALIPIIPVENLFRALVGTVIGTGVITGLRAVGLVKPAHGLY
ncbi:MAG: hypothetical protein GX620_15230 [Chloroflexi bacterium]|nr:hypothetical protein [Chloroflexota bacterium]